MKFFFDIVLKLEKFYDNYIFLELVYLRVYYGFIRLSKLINWNDCNYNFIFYFFFRNIVNIYKW